MKTKLGRKDATAEFEQALAQTGQGHYVLRLYLTGNPSRSLNAVQAVKALCEQHLNGRYDLEIVNLCQQPELAQAAQIIAAPTLVKELPPPLRRLIGASQCHIPDRSGNTAVAIVERVDRHEPQMHEACLDQWIGFLVDVEPQQQVRHLGIQQMGGRRFEVDLLPAHWTEHHLHGPA